MNDSTVAQAVSKLQANQFDVSVVADAAAALDKLRELIPNGSSVNTAGSTTLAEIGFNDLLKSGAHSWRNIKGEILAETDRTKQAALRRTTGLSVDVHVTSVSAIDAEIGALHVCCMSGSRTGALLFGPAKVIVVVGKNKFVANVAEATARIDEYCVPVESARARIAYAAYGFERSYAYARASLSGQMMFGGQSRYHVIVVDQILGF